MIEREESRTQASTESTASNTRSDGGQVERRIAPEVTLARPEETMLSLFWRRFRRHRPALIGGGILLVLASICFVVPLFVSEEAANTVVIDAKLQSPSSEHPLGTDAVGRDMLMRCIWGGRISLRIGVLAALIAVMIGIAVGSVAPTPLRLREVEALFENNVPSVALQEEACNLARESVSPIDDIRCSADYRRQLVHVFLHRAMKETLCR